MIQRTVGKGGKMQMLILCLLLCACVLRGQSSWDEDAAVFVKNAANNRYKFTMQEIQGAVDKSTAYINTYCSSCSRNVQSSLYLARANLRIFQLEYRADSADGAYTPPPATLSKIKSDFYQAQVFCQKCKCGMMDNILEFYGTYGTVKQLDSLEAESKAIGKPANHTYLGADLNFTPQKSIASFGIGIVNAWTVLQPKKWKSDLGRKYRKCKYEYPMAVGYCFIGYERSFLDSKYSAAKLDAIWLNYFVSVHPLQLLYASERNGNTFIYRPEIGFSFSTFAVNYALNIPFKGTFGPLAQHNLSIRFTIPAIKLN